MKLVVKVALGIILAFTLLIGGCAVLIGAGADKVADDMKTAQDAVSSATVREDAPAPKTAETLDVARAEGDYAIAQANGSSDNPSRIRLLVSAAPKQRAMVSWTVICTQGAGAGTKSGQRNVTTPASIKLPTPGSADSCDVSANAQIQESGRVKVTIRG